MGRWTLQECMSLIDQVRSQLPAADKDAMSFAKRMKKFDFDSINIPGKTSVECHEKMSEFIKRIRTQRSLSDIFGQLHEDFLKAPKTAFQKYMYVADKPSPPAIRYMRSHMEKFKAKSANTKDMLSMSMKKFHELPPEKKERYNKEYQDELAEYKQEREREMIEFLGSTTKTKSSAKVKNSPAVDALACNMFVKHKVDKKVRKHPDADKSALMAKYHERWPSLSEEKRERYVCEAADLVVAEREAQKLKRQQDKGEESGPKNGSSKKRDPSEPKKVTSFIMFLKNFIAEGHSFEDANKAWKATSQDERDDWKQRAFLASGKTRKTKRATSWGIFVKKHIAAGNTFGSAATAWHALSEKKKKKFIEEAKQANIELGFCGGECVHQNQSSTPAKKRKRPAELVVGSASSSKQAKISNSESDDDGSIDVKPPVAKTKIEHLSPARPANSTLDLQVKSFGTTVSDNAEAVKEEKPHNGVVTGIAAFFKRASSNQRNEPTAASSSTSSPLRRQKNEPLAKPGAYAYADESDDDDDDESDDSDQEEDEKISDDSDE